MPVERETSPAPVHPSFAEAFRFWLKLGFISFGGPTGQIAIMHAELVERKRWIAACAFAGMQRWKWDIIPVVGDAALLGLLHWVLGNL